MSKEKHNIKFPEGFLWGTSTSAYQIEGGIINDWSEWEKSDERKQDLEKKGKKVEEFVSGLACDSWNRYQEDFSLAKDLNNNAIRFGIEWARVEPSKGVWDVKVINHYRDMLECAKKNNFKIALTIWHWTNPLWFRDKGGWTARTSSQDFLEFVNLVIKEFGAYVDYWVVLNEPMIHVFNAYVIAKFPPARKNIWLANKVFNNLVKAYKESSIAIHKHFPEAQVGITQLVNNFEPAHKFNLIEILISRTLHYFWNHRFLKKINKYMDYVGLDYYFHDRIVWYPPFKKNLNKEVNDMNWEIYPRGIYNVLKYLHKFRKPILILENGLADKNDLHRADFIIDHLLFVHQAIEEGIDVCAYFYWSLLDNFEWAEGYKPCFGLYEVDRKTMERKKRASADVYGKICKDNGIIF